MEEIRIGDIVYNDSVDTTRRWCVVRRIGTEGFIWGIWKKNREDAIKSKYISSALVPFTHARSSDVKIEGAILDNARKLRVGAKVRVESFIKDDEGSDGTWTSMKLSSFIGFVHKVRFNKSARYYDYYVPHPDYDEIQIFHRDHLVLIEDVPIIKGERSLIIC